MELELTVNDVGARSVDEPGDRGHHPYVEETMRVLAEASSQA